MIERLARRFLDNKEKIRDAFLKGHPAGYEGILKTALEAMFDKADKYTLPDPSRIHTIDDGDFQGTLVFLVACGGYQPNTYFITKVFYGSCSGCDTLLQILEDNYTDGPTESQANDYTTLALHMIQNMVEV